MFDQFHYGVCYYPEHWDASRHESDIRRMRECGFDLIRLGESAWGYWEPREGEYQFAMFDRVIGLCRQNGIKVIMGTPTYAAPAWVATNYPEVLRWDYNRQPMAHGSRRNFTYNSTRYNELSDKLCSALAEHYKNEDQIIAWQLDNEFNCHMDVSYAPADTVAFRAWLKEKYKSLEALNTAWGTAFWSQQYDGWEQIDLPHPTATYLNPSMLLDETRFISDSVVRFARRQGDILRKRNSRWKITHNGLFPNINGPDLAGTLDFFSHDQYPLFRLDWAKDAVALAEARSLSFPYGILEQQAGPGGQMQYLHHTPRKGEMRRWVWQSIINGAGFLSYFRWRTCPYGSEQHWHGLLDQDDRDNRRIIEAKKTGEEIRKISNDFFNAPVEKSVAVLRDFDNEANDRRINTYTKQGQWEYARWMIELLHRHIPADMVWPSSDFGGYRLLIAPHLKIMDKALVEKLAEFVRAGGVLVLGAQSGLKDRNCHIVEMPLPGLLRELAGVEVEDWTSLPETESREALMETGTTLVFNAFVERLRVITAQTIAVWTGEDSLLSGAPAITKNAFGNGSVFYIGGYSPQEAIVTLMDLLRKVAGLRSLVEAEGDVEAIRRSGGKRTYLSLINHSSVGQTVAGVPAGREMLSDRLVDGEMVIDGMDVAIIEVAESHTTGR